ncbi:hypothetical protein [Pontimicrobium aquaticum]|uniref:Uncharacterized protein n=1 Tax=Pontimicrobium aquaticum TaxID=2565367 RepID=A0A4U0EWI3_9FLAO|nr:hypothetical protein [Pontimicrobium aquaticum]TJY34742.1 hypothetical protein E5167_10560 [Pontimicrobium aquaticum]
MNNTIVRFVILTVLVLGSVFALHLFLLNYLSLPLLDNKIILSYAINATLAIVIVTVLYLLKEKYKSQLGFLFMAGSALKFFVFFFVFYPYYNLDGDVETLEFFAFFLPYGLSLILETITLSKFLNKLDSPAS